MRKMIPSKFIAWIKKLFGHIDQEGNTTEIGGNLEVDGDLNVSGEIPIDLNAFTNIESLLNLREETREGYPHLSHTTDYSREQVVKLIGKYLTKGIVYTSYPYLPLHLHSYNDDMYGLEQASHFMQLSGASFDAPGMLSEQIIVNFYDDGANVKIEIQEL